MKATAFGVGLGANGQSRFNVQGAAGNAAIATAAKEHALLYAAGLQLARLLQEVSDVPLSTLLLLWTRLSLA